MVGPKKRKRRKIKSEKRRSLGGGGMGSEVEQTSPRVKGESRGCCWGKQ
jgi:hypothetical protein